MGARFSYHNLIVTKIRTVEHKEDSGPEECREINEQGAVRFYKERVNSTPFFRLGGVLSFSLCSRKTSNGLAALQNLCKYGWGKYYKETIKTSAEENLGYYGMRQHKTWFND